MRLTVKDLTPNAVYSIQARSIKDGQYSDWSPITTVTTQGDLTVPAAVTGLTWTVISSNFHAEWVAPTTNTDSSPLTDFKDYAVTVTAGGVSKTYVIGGTTFDFTANDNRSAFGTYQPTVAISVVVRDQYGKVSDPVTATATKPTPNPITSLSWTTSSDAFIGTWVAPTYPAGADFANYEVTLTANSITKVLYLTSPTLTVAFDDNVKLFGTAQGTIAISIRVQDNVAMFSTPVTATATMPAPANVANLTGVAGYDQINLKWDVSLLAAFYEVHTGTAAGFATSPATVVASPTTNSYVHTTVAYGQDTYFKVFAVSRFGIRSLVPAATATALRPKSSVGADVVAPGVPTISSATIATTAGRAAATVVWTLASPPSDLSGFYIRYRVAGTTNWEQQDAGRDDTTLVLSGLTPYVNYDFQIRAYDYSANYSGWSGTTTATGATNSAPVAVTGLSLSAAANAITATWTESTEDDVKNGAGLYEVDIATNSGFTTGLFTYRTGANFITIGGLNPSTGYWLRVRAVDNGGLVGASSTASNTTTTAFPTTPQSNGTPPASSPAASVSAGIGYLFASWPAVSSGTLPGDTVFYEVHVSTTNGFTPTKGSAATLVSTTPGTFTTIKNTAAGTALVYGTTYYVRVIAYDSDGSASPGTQGSGAIAKVTATDSTLTAGDVGAPTTSAFSTLNATVSSSLKSSSIEYSVNSSETVAPTTGWSTTQPTRNPGTFVWFRTVLTYNDNTTSTSSAALLTGNTGAAGSPGTPGAPAADITLTASTQVLSVPSGGGATNPATSTVTGAALNTTITVYDYSVDGAAFSATVPAGVSRTGNVVTITGSTMTARTITVHMADANGVGDTVTVARVFDGAAGTSGTPGAPGTNGTNGTNGADAYTVLLTNEAQVFAGSTNAALAGTATTSVIAYKATVQQTATIGTITGLPTGMTAAITNNGTNTPTVTFTVTTSMTSASGSLTIPITVGGISFSKVFSYSIAFAGAQGSAGTPGTPGAAGSNGATGATGVGISSVTQYFQVVTTGSAAPANPSTSPPPAPWTTTEPNYTANTELYRTERILYTDSTFAYTTVTKVSSYAAAATAIATANGKSTVYYSTGTPGAAPNNAGDVWFVRDTTTGVISAQYEGQGGTSWVSRTLGSTTISSITAGQIATGTLNAITITVPANGSIQSADYSPGNAGFKLISNGLDIQGGTINAKTLQAGSAFVNTLNVGTGGAIQSAGYTSGGTSGFQLSTSGLVIKGSNNQVSVGSLVTGTISTQSITLSGTADTAGNKGSLVVDAYGEIRSTNWSAGSTGYRLYGGGAGSPSLEINQGSIDAGTLRTNTAIISNLIIGTSAGGAGSIQSFDYNSGAGTGFKLNSNSLDIQNGTIAARALQIQDSANIAPTQYADFEWRPDFYTSQLSVSGTGASTGITAPLVPFNGTQALRLTSGSAAATVILGASATDYNIQVEPSTTYIYSVYVFNNSGASQTITLQARGNDSVDYGTTAVAVNDTTFFRRTSVTFTTGSTATLVNLKITQPASLVLYYDGVQLERKMGALNTPSRWKPPGNTQINGATIKTGAIQSTSTVNYDGSGAQPTWSLNPAGGFVVNDAVIRGKLIVGLGTNSNVSTGAAPAVNTNANTGIYSGNYGGSGPQWAITGDGNFTLRSSSGGAGFVFSPTALTANDGSGTVYLPSGVAGQTLNLSNTGILQLSGTFYGSNIYGSTFATSSTVGTTVTGIKISTSNGLEAFDATQAKRTFQLATNGRVDIGSGVNHNVFDTNGDVWFGGDYKQGIGVIPTKPTVAWSTGGTLAPGAYVYFLRYYTSSGVSGPVNNFSQNGIMPNQYTGTIFFGTAAYDLNATAVTTGGSLPAGDYYYVVTSIAGGESNATWSEAYVNTTGTTSTVTLTWSAVTGATGYKIYRGTTAGGPYSALVKTVGAVTSTTDTGAATTAATPPTTNTNTANGKMTVSWASQPVPPVGTTLNVQRLYVANTTDTELYYLVGSPMAYTATSFVDSGFANGPSAPDPFTDPDRSIPRFMQDSTGMYVGVQATIHNQLSILSSASSDQPNVTLNATGLVLTAYKMGLGETSENAVAGLTFNTYGSGTNYNYRISEWNSGSSNTTTASSIQLSSSSGDNSVQANINIYTNVLTINSPTVKMQSSNFSVTGGPISLNHDVTIAGNINGNANLVFNSTNAKVATVAGVPFGPFLVGDLLLTPGNNPNNGNALARVAFNGDTYYAGFVNTFKNDITAQSSIVATFHRASMVRIDTAEGISTTAFGTLATVGPVIYFYAPTSGIVRCDYSAWMSQAASTTNVGVMSPQLFNITAGTTVVATASDNDGVTASNGTTSTCSSNFVIYTGLTAGSQYAVRMYYRSNVAGQTATFTRRRVAVVASM
jgi:hypothetical protein